LLSEPLDKQHISITLKEAFQIEVFFSPKSELTFKGSLTSCCWNCFPSFFLGMVGGCNHYIMK